MVDKLVSQSYAMLAFALTLRIQWTEPGSWASEILQLCGVHTGTHMCLHWYSDGRRMDSQMYHTEIWHLPRIVGCFWTVS